MNTFARRAALLVLSVFCLLGSQEGYAMDSSLPAIDVQTLAQRMESPTPPFLLDVREPDEFAVSNIKGAHLIPLGSLASRLAEVPKDKPVVIVCRSGNRSGKATMLLREQGFTNVENLSGGMIAWTRQCSADKKYC